ncbi:hypothetical protein AB0C65_36045 [Nocardia sp. NPDC048505]|uniref:hypothetical protein n=1 Tax=Nocardia sp. NPDC048505 TaxID=3155756 RepID=UPI0033CA1AF3
MDIAELPEVDLETALATLEAMARIGVDPDEDGIGFLTALAAELGLDPDGPLYEVVARVRACQLYGLITLEG